MIGNLVKQYKRQIITVVILLFVIVGSYVLISHDYGLYQDPIGTVVSVEETYADQATGSNGKEETYNNQTLLIQIKNTENKGKTVKIPNEYGESQIKSTRYHKGDDLFLTISEGKYNQKLEGTIINVKRDQYTILLLIIFVIVMILIAGKRGALTLLTLAINVLLFGMMIQVYANNQDFEHMLFLLAAVFTTITLLILGGIKKKSVGSILSTITTVFVIMMLYLVVYHFSEELPYEMMNYISGPDYLESIFRAGIILGCLGAVMDIAITINSSVHEILETTPSILVKELYHSVREIGYDIMGTMINVLFFTFISGCIPMMIIKIANGYSLLSIIRFGIVFDLVRFLIGAIGIVLAIPISSLIAIAFVWKRVVK